MPTCFVTVIPETSRIKEGIRREFRSVDSDAREAGRRWGREIRSGMGDVGVRVDGDVRPAERKIEELTRRPHRTSVKVDVDQPSMNAAASALRAVSTNLTATAVGVGGLLAPNAIAATATSIAQLSGAVGLLPATLGAAGLAFGSLKVATLGFSDAMKEVRDPEKFGEAIAQLSPNAQEAARAIQGLLPQLDTLKFTVQDAFFAGLGNQIQALSATYLPMFQTVMSQMAASANTALTSVSQMLQTPGRSADMSAMTNNMATAFDKLAQALNPIVSAFVDIGLVGSGFLPQLADAATRAAQAFATFVGDARASGELQTWIQGGIDAMAQLGRIAGDIGGIFMSFVQPGSGGLLGAVESITSTINDFLNSPAGSGAMQTFMSTITTTINALMPALSSFLQAIAPILAGLGQFVAIVLQAAAPALTTWFNAMQPVIQQVMAQFIPVLQTLQPVLAQVAMLLADQMVAGIQQILPVLVPFVSQMGQLLVAVMPLLPPLVQLATSLMPIFQQALATILPVLTQFASVLTAQANTVVPLMTGQLGLLAGAFSALSTPIQTAYNIISPILDALSTKIQQILDGPIGKLLGALSGPLPRAVAAITGNLPSGGVPAATIPGLPPMPGQPGYTPPAYGQFGAANAQRQRRGAAPVAPSVGIPTTALPVPAVSSYVAPPPAATGGGSGGSTRTAADFLGGYTSDAALLSQVRPGTYSQSADRDLLKGLSDCSSSIGDLVYLIDKGTTDGPNLTTGNAASMLPGMGFVRGMGGPGDFRIGYNSGHMQATLPGGTPWNWGSNAAAARGGVGGTGADDPAFTDHWYRPMSGSGGNPVAAAYPGSSDLSGYMNGDPTHDKRIRDAGQRVDDTANRVESAQMRLDELNAKGTTTALQRKNAEDALAKAKREHADAQTDLNTALQKGDSLDKSKSGSATGEQLGQDIVKGMMDVFGFGDVFKDPTEFGLFKMFKGVMGLKFADQGQAQGGDGASLFGGGGGGGGGPLGMLSGFLKPFGDLNPSNPTDAPGKFMPAMNGSGGGGIVAPGGILADPNSPAGAPGPGNSAGSYNDFRGAQFGYSPTGVKDQVNSAHLQQVRQPLRSLPN